MRKDFAMHHKRSCQFSAFALLVTLLYGGTVAFATDKEMEQSQQLAAVSRKGLAELLDYVCQTKTHPPLIYSQWYVDRLVAKNPKKGEIEQARREFGRTVLQSLEDLAPKLRAPTTAQTRQDTATMLLELADWFGEQPGYGNALIFHRLQDMATVPLAYLITDLSYPETNLVQMVSRLVDFPEEVKRNARVLNEESPTPIFEVPTASRSSAGVWTAKEKAKVADSVVNPVERGWYRKLTDIREWQKKQGKPVTVPSGKSQRDELPEDFAFFADDEMSEAPKPFTTLNQWDKKYHRRLFLGLGSQNIEGVKSFLLFRQKVGSFPTTPPSWWKPGDAVFPTPTKAAFDEAWTPFRHEYDLQSSAASKIYDALQSNVFYDEDTRKVREHESLQQANEALKSRQK